jgi:hypothetical protein
MKLSLMLFPVLVIFSMIPLSVTAQTQIPLPAHATNYSAMARGYWFIAPTSFTITGLKVAPEAGAGLQYIHLLKCHDLMPIAFSTPSTNFTTLSYISGAPNNTIAPVNIQIQQGDTLVIMGTVTGNANSYTVSAINHTSSIGTHSITMGRAGTQGSIESGPAPNFWGYDPAITHPLGRVFIYYTLASATDAGLETFVFPSDTLCEGPNDVVVRLKNHGPDPLMEVDIAWSVNQVSQPAYTWTGNLAVNDTDDVVIGGYHFLTNTTYQLKAYTHEPNYTTDTINNLNDTILFTGPNIKPAPGITVNDTVLAICQGDTAWISGTLTGTPPWSFTIIDGTTQHSFAGITNFSFNIPMTPATSRTYTIEAIGDATGCETATGPKITVSVQAAPPAAITPMGPPAACMGDTVMLMGSVGLNFTYQWYHDGTLVPGATNYLLAAKAGGNYTVLVTSPIGCSKLSAPYTVYIHPLPAVSLGNDTALLPHQSILLNAGAGFNSYLWSTGATSASLLVDTAGAGIGVQTIWVNVTDNNTCKGGDTILINFTPHPGIAGVSTDASLELFPNPTTGRVTLHLNRFPAGKCTVELFRPDGRAVFRKEHTVSGAEEQLTLDLQHLPAGVYTIYIISSGRTLNQKIIIRK